MTPSARTLASLIAALGLAAAACIATDGFCPCGTDPDAPLGSHDPEFAGDHLVNDACICECGEDPVIAADKDDDGDCPDDGQACTDELGRSHEIDCS